MEGETGNTRSINDELHSWSIQGDQMEGESSATRSIIDTLHSSDIQPDQMEGESCFTGSIIDEVHSSDVQRDQTEEETGVTRTTMMIFSCWISKETKWKVKVVLLKVSLMNFNLRI